MTRPACRRASIRWRVVLLPLELVLGDRDLPLERAQHQIVRRDLGGDADLQVADVPLGRLDAGAGALDLAPRAAEQVDLPRRVGAERPGRDAAAGQGDALAGRRAAARSAAAEGAGEAAEAGVLAEVDPVERRAGVERRQAGGARLALLRPGAGDAAARGGEVEVAGDGALDEAFEHGVAELRPPPAGVGRRAGGGGRQLVEARRDGDVGAHVVRPDGAAGERDDRGKGDEPPHAAAAGAFLAGAFKRKTIGIAHRV